MSYGDSSIHLKPLSIYSQMVCAEQQSKANGSFYNIKVHISNQEARARKRRLDDSCFDEICETPLKKPCIFTTCSPDQGCFSFDFQESTPLQTLIITKDVTPPRSKVNQPVTPVVSSTPLSKYTTNLICTDRESLPSPIPLLKWDREATTPGISLYAPLNLDRLFPSVGSEGTVKVEKVSQSIIPTHESIAKPPPKNIVPLKEEELLSVSQQAEPEARVGHGESTAESFESTLPLQVQVKSKVVVPDHTKACEPVVCEEEWERNKRTYVESVRRHMTEQNGVISELDSLMNSIANRKIGRNDPHWQHPSDLTRRNYKMSRAKHPLISLEEWQKQNLLNHRRFVNVPDIFQRSPVL